MYVIKILYNILYNIYIMPFPHSLKCVEAIRKV